MGYIDDYIGLGWQLDMVDYAGHLSPFIPPMAWIGALRAVDRDRMTRIDGPGGAPPPIAKRNVCASTLLNFTNI